MTSSGESSSAGAIGGGPFLERVRHALGHDLHTPLGTIANYAAILEYQGEAKPEEVRVYANRIRTSAVRMSTMLRQVADAITLSQHRTPDEEVDPSSLIRALISELNLQVSFPARGRDPATHVPFDRDLLAFAWRAFLAVNAEAAAAHALDLDIEVEKSEGENAITLWMGSRPATAPTRVSSSRFSDDASGVVPPESCFALGLAEWLIRHRGGDFGLWGRPAQAAGLRIAFAPTGA